LEAVGLTRIQLNLKKSWVRLHVKLVVSLSPTRTPPRASSSTSSSSLPDLVAAAIPFHLHGAPRLTPPCQIRRRELRLSSPLAGAARRSARRDPVDRFISCRVRKDDLSAESAVPCVFDSSACWVAARR
jgi:hypothetical protein